MKRIVVATLALIAAVGAFARRSHAHELAEASATLVVRDGGHVEIRLQVPWSDVLHERLAPRLPMNQLLVQLTNQDPAAFARRLASIDDAIARDTRLITTNKASLPFVRWRWPSAAEVQNALRRELMSRLAQGADFEHASRLTAIADVVVDHDCESARLSLSPLLGPALLTVVRPREEWLAAGKPSAPVLLR